MPHNLLFQLVALVFASALIAYVCHRLNILPIVGFLLAGVAIGPHALGLVGDAEMIDFVAEIGVVLLLFTLGIEFSLDRLWKIKQAIFVGGGLQLILTMGATMGVLALFGVGLRAGFYTGALVALSSTAIVLKTLEGRGELATDKGQLSLGILIFQDLAIIALVLIVPLLAGDGGSPIAIATGLGTALAIVVVAVLIARRIMPVILERVARTCSPEIFLLTIIAICLGTAWLTSLAGVSLSLGAFLAGLVVSESRFSHHAFAEILPLQILFSAVFFVSVGMLLDLGFVATHPLLILGVVAAVVILKSVVTTIAARILGYSLAVSGATALLVAQIGEFSFVLARVGRDSGLHPAGVAGMGQQTFIATAVLLMVATPLLAKAGVWLEERAKKGKRDAVAKKAESEPVERLTLSNHVIVAGYGAAARYLTRVMRDAGVPFAIVTLSPTGATEAQEAGLRVVVGDYSRRYLLDLVNIDSARMLIIPDDAPAMAARVVSVARGLNPTLQIIVRTRAAGDVDGLIAEGANDVIVDEMEIGVQLFTSVLTEYQLSAKEIDEHVESVRARGYAALRAGLSDKSVIVCEEFDQACFEAQAAATTSDDDTIAPARTIALTPEQRGACEHAGSVESAMTTVAGGCEECMKTGDRWVHLRICMTCGAVRCCDSSPNKHATRHFHESAHPVIRSYQPGELWAWCYVDEKML